MIYEFDGTFTGLLTAVFESFELKATEVKLVVVGKEPTNLFEQSMVVVSQNEKADRVWKGLAQKLNQQWLRKFYCTYLSEQPEAYQTLFNFCVYAFKSSSKSIINYGHIDVINISKFAKSVEREKHRMEAFIRFQLSADGLYFASIDPDFNVLPLLLKHFKNRYADQHWVIYDLKRKYGLHYNLIEVNEITFSISEEVNLQKPKNEMINNQETLYALLWKDYFKSTNIESRKNTKLHVQHVPKRYWKYLTEKQL